MDSDINKMTSQKQNQSLADRNKITTAGITHSCTDSKKKGVVGIDFAAGVDPIGVEAFIGIRERLGGRDMVRMIEKGGECIHNMIWMLLKNT